MGGVKGLRTALIASSALAATAFAAAAQEAPMLPGDAEPTTNQVNFSDPNAPIGEGSSLNLTVRDDTNARFSALDNPGPPNAEGPRRLELSLAAGGEESPLDVSISQRASLGADRNGDLDHQGRGSELRVGRGLVDERDRPRDATYVFVASDNEALTWQPGTRNEFGGRGGSFSMQDQVEVGDLSAGVTWERGGIQTSLAYVEREQSTRVGNQTYSHDENFAGVTVTMRH
jgi:hypothetical protein